MSVKAVRWLVYFVGVLVLNAYLVGSHQNVLLVIAILCITSPILHAAEGDE